MPHTRLVLLALALVITGCTSTGGAGVGTRLVGDWKTTLAGFTFVTSYTADQVVITGEEPDPYQLDGDLLIIDGDKTTARRVSFDSRNEMIQTDVITGTAHRYTRVTE